MRPCTVPWHYRRKFYPISLICTILILAGLPCSSIFAQQSTNPQSWHLGLRSTGYFFQTQNFDQPDESQYQGFQTISGSAAGLANGRLQLRGSGRFANDLALTPYEFQTSRLYNGYAEARITPQLKARLGRQFLHSGVAGLTLDGGWISYRHNKVTHTQII